MERGKLYVFEGADGVGKSTLAKKLQEYLRSRGMSCELLAFPGKDPGTLGAHIYDVHHYPSKYGINSPNPISIQILHIAAHVEAIEDRIRPLLEKGVTVLLDRYWWSTWVYGIASGVPSQSLQQMINLEMVHWGDIKPDTIFLVERKSPLRDEDMGNWKKWIKGYQTLAKAQENANSVVLVRNNSTVAEAMARVLDSLSGGARAIRPAQLTLDLPAAASSQVPTPTQTSSTVIASLSPIQPSEVYDTYWRFAAERQEIFFKRLSGFLPPFSNDPILQRHKFTNAYRASDRVSQFLIRRVIYQGEQSPEEVFFRTILFKVFNKIETWLMLQKAFGTITYREYSFDRYDQVLEAAMRGGDKIYSAAYIMPSGGRHGESRKHRSHLRLLEQMMQDGVPHRITDCTTMKQAFELLRSYPMIGDFLAYQYVTDLNYSDLTNFTEMEFVVPGPGARDGLRKCFTSLGDRDESGIIRLMAERQEQEFSRLGIAFKSLWGRPLQLIDCQNLFCEVDKYARVAHPDVKGLTGRSRIKQIFTANPVPIHPWYPPKWNINHLIPRDGGGNGASV